MPALLRTLVYSENLVVIAGLDKFRKAVLRKLRI
jgi:hypothetical protein